MIILLFSVAALMPNVIAHSCYHQRCIGCQPEQAAGSGIPIECHINNVVSQLSIHHHRQSMPPNPGDPPYIGLEYRCLQMVATPDDTTFGNTVDRIRGCVPELQVDTVCAGLAAVQRARGHSNVRCYICQGNNCNSVGRIAAPLYVALLLPLLFFIFS